MRGRSIRSPVTEMSWGFSLFPLPVRLALLLEHTLPTRRDAIGRLQHVVPVASGQHHRKLVRSIPDNDVPISPTPRLRRRNRQKTAPIAPQSSKGSLDDTCSASCAYVSPNSRSVAARRGYPAPSAASACARHLAASFRSGFPVGSTQWAPREL